jgi:hypothetical protein
MEAEYNNLFSVAVESDCNVMYYFPGNSVQFLGFLNKSYLNFGN